MKKLEKNIILKDLDYINNEISIKTEKLNTIISFFMEEECNLIEEHIKEKNDKEFQEQQRVIQDDNIDNEPISEDQNIIDDPISDTQYHLDELPNDIKIIYRKIVMLTHPDKNTNNNNLEICTNFYKRSIKAKNENDISELLYIAYKLNIVELYDINDEHFNNIKTKINDIKNKSKMNLYQLN